MKNTGFKSSIQKKKSFVFLRNNDKNILSLWGGSPSKIFAEISNKCIINFRSVSQFVRYDDTYISLVKITSEIFQNKQKNQRHFSPSKIYLDLY